MFPLNFGYITQGDIDETETINTKTTRTGREFGI
jgi:hypothetical protein